MQQNKKDIISKCHPWMKKRRRFFGNVSIQTKMLVIIVPLIVVPMLILAIVGFFAASGEAAKNSTRYLKQRENDLRDIAENLAIRDYYSNQVYGLTDEAEVYRRALERSLKRFADRSNSSELIYTQVRYVDQRGVEVVKIRYPQKGAAAGWRPSATVSSDRQQVTPGAVFHCGARPGGTSGLHVTAWPDHDGCHASVPSR